MFDSILTESSSCQLERIRNAISNKSESSVYAAMDLGLSILKDRIDRFRSDLDAIGKLGDWESELVTYNRAIEVMEGYYSGNSKGLTEYDARIYYGHLDRQLQHFSGIASEIIDSAGDEA